jgi:hypothetical protein
MEQMEAIATCINDDNAMETTPNLDTRLMEGSKTPEIDHVTHNELNDSQIKAEEEE